MTFETFFQKGKNNIVWIDDNFQKHFAEMPFVLPKKLKLKTKILERYITDKEILDEFKPKESTLGELAWALRNPEKVILLRNGNANIFYIRDKSNVLWAVRAYWTVDGGGWLVSAYSVERPGGWREGYQVVSQEFGSLDTLPLELKINGVKYRKV